ncbi:uncharacterized protein F4807DRAFT_342132 [Annulohypoxylon truncatum]|uniref:uncharacterized protein n=1 Tax=Annulohypoxylon truncatum TaxID=327061 RepID=UPI002008391D|nr:uncharacterized protein F4807DRAFT_342132 [Annulohypoxylon truncatum]KAI1212596.1 hypothetical protein F4807DRAFT_342132 [Annulohypoxylon truncatum]
MAHDSSQWLQKDVKDIDPTSRQLLESYAGLAPEEVVPHCLAIRDKAFALYPWPCIGQMRFIRLSLASYPSYASVLERIRSNANARFLDLGCCFGQDIRKLFIDGARPEQLVGLDLVPEFNALSYELFRDASKLSFEFHARDLHDDNADWSPLLNRFDVLHLTSLLHIWNWEGQVKAAQRIASFTKPGALLVGSGLGSGVGGEFPNLEGNGTNFRQSEETFQKFWQEVGEKTKTKWAVKTTFKASDSTKMNMNQNWAEPNMGLLIFEVTRVE